MGSLWGAGSDILRPFARRAVGSDPLPKLVVLKEEEAGPNDDEDLMRGLDLLSPTTSQRSDSAPPVIAGSPPRYPSPILSTLESQRYLMTLCRTSSHSL